MALVNSLALFTYRWYIIWYDIASCAFRRLYHHHIFSSSICTYFQSQLHNSRNTLLFHQSWFRRVWIINNQRMAKLVVDLRYVANLHQIPNFPNFGKNVLNFSNSTTNIHCRTKHGHFSMQDRTNRRKHVYLWTTANDSWLKVMQTIRKVPDNISFK